MANNGNKIEAGRALGGARRRRIVPVGIVGGALVLAACGTRVLTSAEPVAKIVATCSTPGRSHGTCSVRDMDMPDALRLAARTLSSSRATTSTTPTTAATTTVATTAAPTTTAETAPANDAAAPADAPAADAPAADQPAPEAEAPADDTAPAPEEEPDTTPTTRARKPNSTPKATPAPAPAATDAPAPDPAPQPPAEDTTAAPAPAAVKVDTSVGGRVIALVNAQRAAAGLGPVSANGALTAAAAGHSKDQAANHTMSHSGSNGSTMAQRVSAAGYGWRALAENVAAGYGSADSVMNGWMNSAGHRANIMNGTYVHIGVAVAYAADGTAYWTMDLGAPA